MKIDVISLGDNLKTFSDLITRLEENELNFIFKVMSLKDIWNDGYTTSFFESMQFEDEAYKLLINDLKEFKDMYEYIYEKAFNYGKNIEVNFSNANRLSSQFNSCNQMFSTINSIYNGLDLSYCSEVAASIYNQRSKFSSTNNSLNNYVNKFNKVVANLKEIDETTRRKANDLSVTSINSIDFYHLPIVSDVGTNVGMTRSSEIEKELKNINVNITDEENIMSDILSIFNDFNNSFISNNNSYIIKNKQRDFEVSFKVLVNNHNNLIPYVDNIKTTYLELTKKTTKNVKKDIKGV